MKQLLLQFCRQNSAVSAIEYSLLGALIAVVVVTAIGSVGTEVLGLFTYVKEQVVGAVS